MNDPVILYYVIINTETGNPGVHVYEDWNEAMKDLRTLNGGRHYGKYTVSSVRFKPKRG